MAANVDELSGKIYFALGGKENIIKVYNCMTRVRVNLRNKDENITENLKKISGVMGVHIDGEEIQIVVGPGTATKISDKLTGKLKNTEAKIGDGKELHEKIREQNNTPFKRLLKTISSIFIPLIPAFIACGLITGILGAVSKVYPDIATTAMYQILATLGNSVFWGMNLFVGYNAAKVFGGSPILGGALGALLTHPALSNITLNGEALVPGRGGVIAVIMVAFLGAKCEKFFHRIIPQMFDLFFTPLCSFLTAGLLAIFILQPIGGVVSTALGSFATNAIHSGGAIVGFILAGIWLPLVMLGVHHMFTPIHVDLISNFGVTILLPILAMAGAGQVGASFAVYVKTKNKFLKKTVASALPVGMMGVGEPLIYGVTLPLGRPFIAACIGAAFGGALVASFAVGASAIGISGLPLAGATNNILAYLAGIALSYVMGFIAAFVLGFDDPPEEA